MYEEKDFSQLIGMVGLSEAILTNHFALYSGYVKHTNLLIEKIPTLPESQELDELRRRFGWEWNGVRLHELYFENLINGSSDHNIESALHGQLEVDFGSHPNWEEQIRGFAKTRGVGWLVLYYDKSVSRLFNVWIGEHNINHLAGCEPIVVIDLWEHAYMLDYGTKKDAYIEAVLEHINWTVVEERFNAVQ